MKPTRNGDKSTREVMGKFNMVFNEAKNESVRKNNTAYEQLVNTLDDTAVWNGCAVFNGRIDIRVGMPEGLINFLQGKIIKIDGIELYKNTASSSILTIEGDKISPSMDFDRFFIELIDQLKERIVEI